MLDCLKNLFLKWEDECETSAWPPKPETLAPTYVVNLDLPPKQRWNDVVTIYKSQVELNT
jgi:hypothetical protein